MPMNDTSAIFTYQSRESTIDFDGHIAMLLFTKGCNFLCRYCHNPELIARGGKNMSYDELGARLNAAKNNWVDAVCVTGGEPCLQRNLPETAMFIKSKGFSLKLDTNGSFPEILGEALPFCDYIAIDCKAPRAKYSAIAGAEADYSAVAASLDILKNRGVPYEIRTTIVPGFHSKEDILAMCSEIKGARRLVLQPFIPRDNLPDASLRGMERTGSSALQEFASLCAGYFGEVITR
jgi:pyruvate formate lyase activating enzyme